MFFRSSNHHVRAESNPVIYHQSESIRLESETIKKVPPRLLFILEESPSFELREGSILRYEDSNYGALLNNEAGEAAFIHGPIEAPNGSGYHVVGAIPESLPLYAYASGENLFFCADQIPATRIQAKELWWMGKGVYLLHQDKVWRHQNCRLKQVYQDTIYLDSYPELSYLTKTLIDARPHIRRNLEAMGLSVQHQYSNLTMNQCQHLEQIAEQWWLHWAWSEREIRRRFQKSIRYCTFSWSYPEGQ